MYTLEGKWTKVFYLDVKLTYLRLCGNEAKYKLGFFQGEWVPVMT